MPIEGDKVLEELFKSRLSQLRADSEYATQAISQIVRLTALGLVGLVIPFITTKQSDLSALLQHKEILIFICGVCGAIAIILEICQNCLVDKMSRANLGRIAHKLQENKLLVNSPKDFMAPRKETKAMKRRRYLYNTKLFFVLVGAILFVFILISSVFSSA